MGLFLELSMNKSFRFVFVSAVSSSLLVAGACSKPAAPTPEIAEPSPVSSNTAAPAATEAPAANNSSASDATSLTTVYFDFDSSVLTSDTQQKLKSFVGFLKSNSGAKIQIEGHCDERGSNEYNLALGEKRARAIQEFLASEGASSASLSTISYGEERPAVMGSNENSWSKNRRGEFRKL
jgi:peptidoglycan-associated lipoprotein